MAGAIQSWPAEKYAIAGALQREKDSRVSFDMVSSMESHVGTYLRYIVSNSGSVVEILSADKDC